ncbi:MAG: hypothetical protein AB7H80_14410, partial [Candidatus Kapaibacterium sp.]
IAFQTDNFSSPLLQRDASGDLSLTGLVLTVIIGYIITSSVTQNGAKRSEESRRSSSKTP